MFHGTTILAVRKNRTIAVGCDGRVTQGSISMKENEVKMRSLKEGTIITAFSGTVSDGHIVLDMIKDGLDLNEYKKGKIYDFAVGIGKKLRKEKDNRGLSAFFILADYKGVAYLDGDGCVLECDNNVAQVGTGGQLAMGAAKALLEYTELSPSEIIKISIGIAGDSNVFCNKHITVMSPKK